MKFLRKLLNNLSFNINKLTAKIKKFYKFTLKGLILESSFMEGSLTLIPAEGKNYNYEKVLYEFLSYAFDPYEVTKIFVNLDVNCDRFSQGRQLVEFDSLNAEDYHDFFLIILENFGCTVTLQVFNQDSDLLIDLKYLTDFDDIIVAKAFLDRSYSDDITASFEKIMLIQHVNFLDFATKECAALIKSSSFKFNRASICYKFYDKRLMKSNYFSPLSY